MRNVDIEIKFKNDRFNILFLAKSYGIKKKNELFNPDNYKSSYIEKLLFPIDRR